jgi:hypothetical protein
MKEQIAAALRSNQLTAKEIAENLGENYKTVFGHLAQMKAIRLVELLDDKTYVLTDFGIGEFAAEPPKIDALPPKITPKKVSEVMQQPTQAKSFEQFYTEKHCSHEVKPINEKTVNEIKRTVNYDATTPSHYQGKTMQVFDVLNEFLTVEANHGFYVGNVIKYVVRFKGKNGKEDLLKAREYLNKLIDSL